MFSHNPPLPWTGPLHIAIGGLWALGFDDVERLVCITASGLGVIDAASGTKIARDYDSDHYDLESETVEGIGPSTGQRIRVAGQGGGIQTAHRLCLKSADGWEVVLKQAGADTRVLLVGPERRSTEIAKVEPLYAHGFSPSGRILVLGESHTITIFRR